MATAAVTHPRTSPPLAYAIISYSFACLGCPLKGKYEWANYVKHWCRKISQRSFCLLPPRFALKQVCGAYIVYKAHIHLHLTPTCSCLQF